MDNPLTYKYADFRNFLIYKVLSHIKPDYFKKQIPDYLIDDLSYLDILDIIKIKKLGARASHGSPVKVFFVETVFNNKLYLKENYISEKIAIIELALEIGIDMKLY